MKVFISWAGTISHSVAKELKKWLPDVIQGLDIFLSSELRKGTDWNHKIHEALKDSRYGLVVLTKDNLTSPWLHYEAGALTQHIADGVERRVSPLLHEVEISQVSPPLQLRQITKLGKRGDILKLVESINELMPSPLSNTQLERTFNVWYQSLADALATIPDSDPEENGESQGVEPEPPAIDYERGLMTIMQRLEGIEDRIASTRVVTKQDPRIKSQYITYPLSSAESSLSRTIYKVPNEEFERNLHLKVRYNLTRFNLDIPFKINQSSTNGTKVIFEPQSLSDTEKLHSLRKVLQSEIGEIEIVDFEPSF